MSEAGELSASEITLTDRIRASHPLRYGFNAQDEMIEDIDAWTGPIFDEMARCPRCEQWSPCDCREAADMIDALRAEVARLTHINTALRLDNAWLETIAEGRGEENERLRAELSESTSLQVVAGTCKLVGHKWTVSGDAAGQGECGYDLPCPEHGTLAHLARLRSALSDLQAWARVEACSQCAIVREGDAGLLARVAALLDPGAEQTL